MLTMGLAGTTAQADTCVDPGPAELCVEDPVKHDAGQASLEDGDVSAQANGGIVTGAGEATFVMDYVIDLDGLPSGTVDFTTTLEIRNSENQQLIRQQVNERDIPTGADAIQGQIEANVSTLTPLADGGTVHVSAGATLDDGSGTRTLGQAQSVAPITFAVAPPADVAERIHPADTVDAGSFEAGPSEASASAIDGQLIVAQDTSLRFEAEGTLSSHAYEGDTGRQTTRASLSVATEDQLYSASVSPITNRCFTSCSVPAETASVELSIVIPGDLVEPNQEADVDVDASWFSSRDAFERNDAREEGANEILVVGP